MSVPTQANSDYLLTSEVAAMSRKPAETLRYYRHVGKGPKSFKLGRTVLYAREDVEAWLREARDAG